jgi:hypothetical protein
MNAKRPGVAQIRFFEAEDQGFPGCFFFLFGIKRPGEPSRKRYSIVKGQCPHLRADHSGAVKFDEKFSNNYAKLLIKKYRFNFE